MIKVQAAVPLVPVWGAAIGSAAGATGGYLYDRYEKSKQAEYQKGCQAGQQSVQKSQ